MPNSGPLDKQTLIERSARIIALFVKKEKRERLEFLAAKESRRADFIDALLHDTRSLDRSRMTAVGAKETELDVVKRLRATAKARAHCISAITEIDDRELPLGDALRAAMGRERDTIVFCLDSSTAYYENHEGERFVLA